MSRRRFFTAEQTFNSFIHSIEDHKRRRNQQSGPVNYGSLSDLHYSSYPSSQLPPAPSPPPLPVYHHPSYTQNYEPPLQSPTYQTDDFNALSQHLPTDIAIGEGDYDWAPSAVASATSGWREAERSRERERYHDDSAATKAGAAAAAGIPLSDDIPVSADDAMRIPLLSEANKAAPVQEIWMGRRNLDEVVKKRSWLIMLNAMFGIMLMVIIHQVCWSSSWIGAHLNQYTDDYDWDHMTLYETFRNECPTEVRSFWTEGIKLVLCCSTLVLCWQVLERKKLQLAIKFREKRRRMKNAAIKSADSTFGVSTFGLLSLRPSMFRWKLWVQILVCLIQPLPFGPILTHGWINDKIGLLMFFRLHLAFRVVRDSSEIWLNRRNIKRLSEFSARAPNFDWWLSVKTVCYRSPILFSVTWYLISILLFGYTIFIFERDYSPQLFTYGTSTFLSFQCVTVLWASDVYNQFNPITWEGKFACIFAAMSGLMLSSFIIGIVGQQIMPTKFEETALNCVRVEKMRQKERESSAALIQFVWKNYLHEKDLQDKLETKNPRLYIEVSEQEEKEFMEEFLNRCKNLRNIRRERVELEEHLDPTSSKNISPIDQYFDTKLDALRTDIQHFQSRQQQQFTYLQAILSAIAQKTAKQAQMVHKQAAHQMNTYRTNGNNSTDPTPTASGQSKRSRRRRATDSTNNIPLASPVATVSSIPETQENEEAHGENLVQHEPLSVEQHHLQQQAEADALLHDLQHMPEFDAHAAAQKEHEYSNDTSRPEDESARHEGPSVHVNVDDDSHSQLSQADDSQLYAGSQELAPSSQDSLMQYYDAAPPAADLDSIIHESYSNSNSPEHRGYRTNESMSAMQLLAARELSRERERERDREREREHAEEHIPYARHLSHQVSHPHVPSHYLHHARTLQAHPNVMLGRAYTDMEQREERDEQHVTHHPYQHERDYEYSDYRRRDRDRSRERDTYGDGRERAEEGYLPSTSGRYPSPNYSSLAPAAPSSPRLDTSPAQLSPHSRARRLAHLHAQSLVLPPASYTRQPHVHHTPSMPSPGYYSAGMYAPPSARTAHPYPSAAHRTSSQPFSRTTYAPSRTLSQPQRWEERDRDRDREKGRERERDRDHRVRSDEWSSMHVLAEHEHEQEHEHEHQHEHAVHEGTTSEPRTPVLPRMSEQHAEVELQSAPFHSDPVLLSSPAPPIGSNPVSSSSSSSNTGTGTVASEPGTLNDPNAKNKNKGKD